MASRFSQYEIDISEKLQPLRTQLASGDIPVASLPKEAARYTTKYPGSIRVVVGASYRGKQAAFGGQDREVDVSVYIRLSDRYEETPPPTPTPTPTPPTPTPTPPTPTPISAGRRAAIDWVEESIFTLLLGYSLPGSATELILKNGNLLPPEHGEWQKVINFSFVDRLDFYRDETPILNSASVEETNVFFGRG